MPDASAAARRALLSPVSVVVMGDVTTWARETAAARMAQPLPRRWAHVRATAAKAENLRLILGADADLVVAATWLHDIGYAPSIEATGFHPLERQ